MESVAEATGVATVVKKILGDDCGCKERKVALNKRFSFVKSMTGEEASIWLFDLRAAWKEGRITKQQQETALKLYESVFRIRHKMSRCGSCVNQKLADLEQAYLASCEDSTTETKPE